MNLPSNLSFILLLMVFYQVKGLTRHPTTGMRSRQSRGKISLLSKERDSESESEFTFITKIVSKIEEFTTSINQFNNDAVSKMWGFVGSIESLTSRIEDISENVGDQLNEIKKYYEKVDMIYRLICRDIVKRNKGISYCKPRTIGNLYDLITFISSHEQNYNYNENMEKFHPVHMTDTILTYTAQEIPQFEAWITEHIQDKSYDQLNRLLQQYYQSNPEEKKNLLLLTPLGLSIFSKNVCTHKLNDKSIIIEDMMPYLTIPLEFDMTGDIEIRPNYISIELGEISDTTIYSDTLFSLLYKLSLLYETYSFITRTQRIENIDIYIKGVMYTADMKLKTPNKKMIQRFIQNMEISLPINHIDIVVVDAVTLHPMSYESSTS